MTSEQFCYWLQGFMEINVAGRIGSFELDQFKVQVIKDHLQTVFKKETPLRGLGTLPDRINVPYTPWSPLSPIVTCGNGGANGDTLNRVGGGAC